ncbi:hypothetical protein [Streptomyces sp. A1547]|uniref:hypothetical protein n=1 Tax=Streptomyces sp. A1547 TaxID=2563105 RepID=UPI00109EAB4F|nr:hypothetical protein [Streptomyces sp. A1547]THA33019.1 hypothetical protein E6W17_32120 [Streptomyces sp. A1547]
MSTTGNSGGNGFDPQGEDRDPTPSRGSHDAWSLAISTFGALFGDDVSDWMISTGSNLVEYITNSL